MDKFKHGIVKVVLKVMVIIIAISFCWIGSDNSFEVDALATGSVVYVDEIYDSENKVFNETNLTKLKRYLTGYEKSSTNILNSQLEDLCILNTNSSDIRSKEVSIVSQGVSKKSGQDVVVTLGGLQWQAMYLSKDMSGNSILTLWLHSSKIDDNGANDAGEYHGYIDGYLYSSFSAGWKDAAISGNYTAANMYGMSYLNAVTLNNAGRYSLGANSWVSGLEKKAENPFALFTMEEYGLTKFLTTPRDVSWQRDQGAVALNSELVYRLSNDSWSKTLPDNGFYSSEYNYADITHSDAWSNSYLWLPSLYEVGHEYSLSSGDNLEFVNVEGLWAPSVNQRMDRTDDFEFMELGTVGQEGVSAYNLTWLRSAGYNDFCLAFMLGKDGDNILTDKITVNTAAAVRPALHLNLSAIDGFSKCVRVGEIWDSESQTFNIQNTLMAMQYVSGDLDLSLYEIRQAAQRGYFVSDIIDVEITSGSTLGVNRLPKSKGKGVVVELGGLDWYVTGLTVNKAGESIVTLWLDNSIQDAWKNRSEAEGEYYGYLNGSLFSSWAYNWGDVNLTNTYPANMYGTSYLNAVTLNNGGYYSLDSKNILQASKNSDSAFAMFTMEEYGLTKYLATPREMLWQEYQTVYSLYEGSEVPEGTYNMPNDAWSPDLPDDGFYSPANNYADILYSDMWADSYVWVPSLVELVMSGAYSFTDNYDGNTTTSIGVVGSKGLTAYADYWMRTAYVEGGFNQNVSMGPGLLAVDMPYSYDCRAVRPAIHLNIDKVIYDCSELLGISATFDETSSEYDGEIKEVNSTLMIDGDSAGMQQGVDYELVYLKDGLHFVSEIRDVGVYTIIINNSDFPRTIIGEYTVTPKDLQSIDIGRSTMIMYTGLPLQFEGSVSAGEGFDNLVFGKDFEFSLVRKIPNSETSEFVENAIDVGTYILMAQGIENYTGTIAVQFEIIAEQIDGSKITVEYETVNIFTGSEITPVPIIKYGDIILKENIDYTLTYSSNLNVSDNALIEIKGVGNFTGTKLAYFSILPKSIKNCTLTIEDAIYNGSDIMPNHTLVVDGVVLVEGEDYTVSLSNNVNAGAATMTVTAKGNYTGEIVKTFTINRKSLEDQDIVVFADEEKTYTGSPITIDIDISCRNNSIDSSNYTVEYENNVKVGDAKAIISGIGNYTGTITVIFKILAQDISEGVLVLENTNYFYSGNAVVINETLTVNGKVLTYDIDYSLEIHKEAINGEVVENAIEIGIYYLVAEGKGGYSGSLNVIFKIIPVNIDTIVLSSTILEYSGSACIPAVIVKAGDVVIDSSYYYYKIFDAEDKEVEPIEIGTYTFRVFVVEGFGETLEAEYEIVAKDIIGAVIEYDNTSYIYNGTAIEPTIVSVIIGEKQIPADSYDVVYSNNIGASNSAKITIIGKGSYVGSASTFFTIDKAQFASPLRFTVSGQSSEDGSLTVTYTGSEFAIACIVKDMSDRIISEEDYLVEFFRDGNVTTNIKDVGSVTIKISSKINTNTGTDNFSNFITGTLNINTIQLDEAVIEVIGSYEYNNSEIIPSFKVYTDSSKNTEIADVNFDYELESNIKAGNAQINITFIGIYSGIATTQFVIDQRNISNLKFTYDVPELVFDGTAKTISWDVVDDIGANLDGQYTYEYSNNINAGTAKITFTGTDNYTGTVTKEFAISQKDISSFTVDGIEDQFYTGSAITPEVVVRVDEDITLASEDYAVTYSSNIIVGTANCTVTGKGNYTGSLVTTFKIVALSISEAIITVEEVEFVYNMSEHRPKPIVTIDSSTLSENTDYTVSYSNNVNAGTAIITITGMTNYTGEKEYTFEISKADIKDLEVINIASEYLYTTSEITGLHVNNVYFKGNLVADSGDNQLIEVEYSDNINVGTATITITPSDKNPNFDGTKLITFEIIPVTLTKDMCYLSITSYEFNGGTIMPIPEVTYKDYTLVDGKDMIISYPANDGQVGTKTINILAMNNSNFTGSVDLQFTITPKSIEDVQVDDIPNKIYTRNNIEPDLVLTDKGRLLIIDVDYTVEYENNVNVGDATIIIRGKGNYLNTSSITTSFKIIPATITSLVLDVDNKVYDRMPAVISASSVKAGDIVLYAGEYAIEYYRNSEVTDDLTSAGDIVLNVISNSNNFSDGSVSATYTIARAVISVVTIDVTEVTYNTIEQKPVITKVLSTNNLQLSEEEYLPIYYRNSLDTNDFINAGKIVVKINSNSENFQVLDDISCEYEILPKSINDEDVSTKYYFVVYNEELEDYIPVDVDGDGEIKDYMEEDQVYIAYLVHPEIIFYGENEEELVKGTSFTFSILNTVIRSDLTTATSFIAVGEYVTTIIAEGNYTGSRTDVFKVNPRDFTEENITVEFKTTDSYYYAGEKITFENLSEVLYVTFIQDGITHEIVLDGTEVEGSNVATYKLYDKETLDYIEIVDGEEKVITITFEEGNYGYYNNLNAGTAMMFLEAVDNFNGVICVEFNILPISLENIHDFIFELDDTELIYSGHEFKPELVSHIYKPFNDVNLVEGEDYTISYINNVNASNKAKAIITGLNNYTDMTELTFTIQPKTLEDSMLQNIDDVYYNGSIQVPDINLIYNSRSLVEDKDYLVTFNEDADFINANDIVITICAVELGNYSGSITYNYKIMQRTLRNLVLTANSVVYNWNQHAISFVVRDMENLVVALDDSNMEVKYYNASDLDTEIDITTNPIINVGQYIIKVTGINNYTGEVSATYSVTHAQLGIYMLSSIANQVYTKEAITPSLEIIYLSRALTKDVDYLVQFSGNVNVGKALVEVEGIGNFAGEIQTSFTIDPMDLGNLTYNKPTLEVEFTGNNVVPGDGSYENILNFGEYALELNKDFVINIDLQSINVGNYDLEIKGIVNYTGTLSEQFTIVPMSISNEYIIISGIVDKTYTGSAIAQDNLMLTNSLSNSLLHENTDFEIEYSNNTDVKWSDAEECANAKIIISAINGSNYTGVVEVFFKILAKELTDVDITIENLEPVEFTGDAHEPKPEVKFNGMILDEDIIQYSYEDNVDYGLASVIISAKLETNFKGSVTRKFEIGLTSLDYLECLGILAEIVYNGSEQKQQPIVKHNEKKLSLNVDYSISYSEDVTNVGEVTIFIIGIGNYNGMKKVTYNIVPLELTSELVVVNGIENGVFTGSAVHQDMEIYFNSDLLVLAKDYTLSYSNNINVSDEAVVNIEFTGNFTGNMVKYFSITAKELKADMIKGLTSYTFTGDQICPEFQIVYNSVNYYNQEEMFDIAYRDNVNVGEALIDIEGRGNFTGDITVSFEIIAKTLTVEDITLNLSDSYMYTGSQITPEIKVIRDDVILSQGTDYDFTYGTNINAGKGGIYLKFKGNYAGNITVQFDIERVDISSNLVESNIVINEEYSGQEIKGNYSLSYLTHTLTLNDYTITYLRNDKVTEDLINVGAIIIKLEGKNNYTGTLKLTYNITPKSMESDEIEVTILTTDLIYTGIEICPEVVVTMDAIILQEGIDYEISYDNNLMASQNAKIIISAVDESNYQDSKQVLFQIAQRKLKVSFVANIEDQVYSAIKITPELYLEYNGIELIKDVDYIVSFSDNTHVGVATVEISGIGNFKSTIVKNFNIIQCSISLAEVSGLEATYVFSSDEIKPVINLLMNGKALELGVDYNIDYSEDCINTGDKEITVTGRGNYKGTTRLEYTITSKDINSSDIIITGIEDKDYANGQEITHDITITDHEHKVNSADSYSCVYFNNINAGKATVIITGKGNYCGTRMLIFNIRKLDTIAYVVCGDDIIYEDNPINLVISKSSVSGTLKTDLLYYVAGEFVYNWLFVPDDTTNYNTSRGTITLTAVALKVIGLVFSGDYKVNYFAYDPFDVSNLIVSVEYNSEKIQEISANKYSFSVNINSLLKVSEDVFVTYLDDENIVEILPINVSRRVISINTDMPKIIANGTQQYLNLTFNNANNLYPVQYKIENYHNINESTDNSYILKRGLYRINITILDKNYYLENSVYDFEVYSSILTSDDNSISMESLSGFGIHDRFSYDIIIDKSSALSKLESSEFGVDGDFVSVYIFEMFTDRDVTVKFNPSVSSLNKLQIYKIVDNKLVLLSFTILDDGIIAVNCNTKDKLYLFENCLIGSDENDSIESDFNKSGFEDYKILIICVGGFVLLCIFAFIISSKKVRRGRFKGRHTISTNQISQVNQEQLQDTNENVNNTNTETEELSDDELIRRYVILDQTGSVIGIRDGAPQSLKQAFSELINDENTNNNPSVTPVNNNLTVNNSLDQTNNYLSNSTNTNVNSIKSNSNLTSENPNNYTSSPTQNNPISEAEVIRKFIICDEKGNVVGIRDDAPDALKQAYSALLNKNNNN